MRSAILTLAFFALVVVTLAKTKEEFYETLEKCCNTTGADPALVKDAFEGKSVEDEKVKCAQACILKNGDAMNDKGEVDTEKMIEMIPKDIPENERTEMKSAIGQCSNKRGENECETAHIIISCVVSKTPKHANN